MQHNQVALNDLLAFSYALLLPEFHSTSLQVHPTHFCPGALWFNCHRASLIFFSNSSSFRNLGTILSIKTPIASIPVECINRLSVDGKPHASGNFFNSSPKNSHYLIHLVYIWGCICPSFMKC